MNNGQLELSLPTKPGSQAARPKRHVRFAARYFSHLRPADTALQNWWFQRMHEVVDRAHDYYPALETCKMKES